MYYWRSKNHILPLHFNSQYKSNTKLLKKTFILVVDDHHQCERSWSQWYNTHHPKPYMSSGDNESISWIQEKFHSICGSQKSRITGVDCVCAGTGEDWRKSVDKMVGLQLHYIGENYR